MASLISGKQVTVAAGSAAADPSRIKQTDSFGDPPDFRTVWSFPTFVALLMLVALWAIKLYTTWGAWGNLSVDSGHEMYVPAMLAEGKVLYRDTLFTYGPAAPYLTGYLYQLFGVNLNVLYWAGALSALGSSTLLCLIGTRLSCRSVGWAAGAVVLLEAFEPSLFCFPLPYASAAVYGCFTGCLFLWLVVNASFSRASLCLFPAGLAAAVALLLKPEFGIACYCTLALLIGARGLIWRSGRVFATDIFAILPGFILCGLVIRWMVSIAGVEFITQENILSWPTSYFMRTYGKMWLERSGFALSRLAFLSAFHRSISVAVVLVALYVLLKLRRTDPHPFLIRAVIFVVLVLFLIRKHFFLVSVKQSITLLLSTVFFPTDMVLYVGIAAVGAWFYFLWKPAASRSLAIPLVLTFSSLLAFRILMQMRSDGYAIYFNGPAVLSFLLLLYIAIHGFRYTGRFMFLGELALCLACLVPVWVHTRTLEEDARKFVPLTTERGTVRVSEHLAENYIAAIQFMKEKASQGQSVLSLPEDTSLYFLSGTYCPTRVYLFIPGAVAPGRMEEETIGEIERRPVDYVLWSNRTFPEYGASVFGRDFDQELGSYLKSHYRLVGPLLASNPVNETSFSAPSAPDPAAVDTWAAEIWQRRPEGQKQ